MKSMHLAHILLQHKFEAEDVLRRMNDGEKFHDLAQKFSQCPSAPQGGDLGQIELKRLDSDFAEAAEILKPNELSPIVRTRFGYHLIKNLG